jgi:hypothetical protein
MLLGAFCAPTQAQNLVPNWYQQSPATSPSARYIHAITYDAAHGQVVLFGGFGGGGDLNDTWVWNGTTWAQENPASSPSPRSAHAMVYDAAHGQVVLFGGLVGAGTRLGDTWLWDGTNWTQASPTTSPSARDGSVMVYDAAHGQVVLFGGVDASGSDVSDTWVWNGTTWTPQSPATSPSARADYSMVYDAAHSQVVLFGGKDGSGNYLSDTWVWNGTNWIQQTPANSPPARYAHGMAYDAALGQMVIFGGYNGSYLNDTWVWDGTNWTQESPEAAPSGRYAPNAITYDVARGQVVLFGGLGSSQFNDTWVWELPGNFGNVNVCPSGQTIPAPCSKTLAFTYNIATTTIFGTTQVVTQGTPGLDFTLGSGSTCTGTVSPGTCTVNVTFAPLAPGLRLGAVQLFDKIGTQLASTPVYGAGEGPAVAFVPGTQTTVNTGSFTLSSPKGATVDAAGNLYISDNGNHRVVKVAANGTATTVGFGLNYPQGLAVDGAGNLFIADNNLNEVVEVPAGCTINACQTTVGFGLVAQLGVAVDGAGDLFVGDFTGSKVVEVPAGCTTSACQTVVYSPASGFHPVGLAVDAAGDLFIAVFSDTPSTTPGKVVEIPAGCTSSGCQTTVGTGWSEPEAVAVDAAGDVFVADEGSVNPAEAPKVVEVPAGCVNNNNCQITVSGILAYGVAVDGKGNVFLPNLDGSSDPTSNQVVVFNRSQPPALSFASTTVGSTSSNSPQSFTIQNIGNQTLAVSNPGLVVNGPNFVQVAGPGTPADCNATFSLAPAEECNLSISFTPQSAGPLTSSAVFTDNALNANPATQTVALSGVGVTVVPTTVAVPAVVGQTQDAATTFITAASLVLGTVSTESSSSVPLGSVIGQTPTAGTVVNLGTAVNLVVSSGVQAGAPNPLTLQNNYFVTGDYVSAGVTLLGTGTGGMATGTINIPSSAAGGNQGVPVGADIIEAFLYWGTVESTPSASGGSGTFDKFPITGQQIGTDLPNPDNSLNGTLRVYRADVNAYLPVGTNGIRSASGTHSVSLPDSGGNGFPLTEGASLVVIYRVLSPNFPLKAVVIYDGSALPASSGTQAVQGFYDAVGGAAATGEVANLYAAGGGWNTNSSSVALPQDANQYTAPLNSGNAYAAVILSTPVNNSDNDGILNSWKTGPGAGDFHAGQPGYYDVKTGSWVPLPGAQHGQRDLFVQLDYMCGTVNPDGSCSGENLFPSPDSNGNDPLAMVQQAFAANGVHLHLEIGNAVQEDSCTDSGSQLCQFPGQPGVISWKNSLEFSKLWPRNLTACATGGDCTARFPYGQKDSYHYVLFGHSLAIPAWNTRYGTLTSITVSGGVTTIVTADRGSGINKCPSRIAIDGVFGNPRLNGVYNTTGCADTKTITVATPGVPNWSYPNNTLPEPVIGLTSGTITSISGYSDLGGADSAVTLGLWLTAPNQDMSKRANVIAGTLFHEIGHTLGLSHGGLYYDTPNYAPTFEANCKQNYQSSMNYLFQLDGVGPNHVVAFSNQTLTTLDEDTASSVTQLTDLSNAAATFSTSAWYVPYASGVSAASPATLHCDGTPLNGAQAYRVDAPIAPITPAWSNGQDINFDGQDSTQMRGFNDWNNIDLRQVGATGGEFASLASVLSFGSSAPQNIGTGGIVALGSGGTIALGSGGTVTLGSGGNVTLGSGGTITLGSGGNITLGSGGTITLGSGGTVTPGSSGTVALGSGGTVAISGSGTITDGGTTTQVPSTGGTYSIGSGGTIALGSGGTVTLGSGGNVTLGSGGTVTLGSGGTATLGSGGNVTLGSGGTIALGSGGTVTLGSGGTVTLGSGGTVTLGSGGTVSGSGGTIALGSGGTVTLGSGGTVTLGSGGNVTLGSGGTVTLGSGGTIALGSGGTVTLGSGGTVTLGSGGTITLGSGGTPTVVGPGTYDFGSGGTITLGSGGTIALGSGGNVTLGNSGGTITLGSGGTIALGSGGTVTLGSGGTVTLGSGGLVALGSGGTIALGSGGTIALGSGGTIALGSGGTIALGSGGTVTLGSGGALSTELTYETANSIVRPPSSPTETPTQTGSVRIDWTAPVFGVVQTYTIYRSSDGGTPIVIGSVSGNPPATEFIDTNPDTTSATVVYTITTTLAPVTIDPTSRQSPPSPPAVLKNDQTITLGPLPSPVLISGPQPTVTATAMSTGSPNLLQVSFSTTGPCSIANQSITNGVSSATVALNNTGSCTVIASQPGATSYNAATSVSGTFVILPQSAAQTITFTVPPPTTAAYNSHFTVAATGGASGNPVTFTSSGACTVSVATYTMTSSTGTCSVIANQAGNSNYVAATPVTRTVNATLAAQTITFITNPPASAAYNSSFTVAATSSSGLPVTFTNSGSSGACSNSGATYTMTNSTGTCSVIANQAGNSNYAAATQVTKTVNATGPLVTVSPSNINFGTVYQGSITTKNITVTNIGTSPVTINQPLLSIVKGGNSKEFVAVNLCLTPLAVGKSCTITIAFVAGPFYTAQTATLQIMDNAPGSPQPVTLSALVIDPLVSFSPTSLSFGTVRHAASSTLNVTLSNPGGTPLIFTGAGIRITGANATNFAQSNNCGSSLAAGTKCTIAVKFSPPTTGTFSANLTVVDNAQAGGGTQTVPLSGKGN